MKKINSILLAAVTMALAACVAESVPQANNPNPTPETEVIPGPTVFTVSVGKAVLDLNGESKPQTFWENGDAISIYSSNDTDLSAAAGHKYVTSLAANATEASFELDGGSTVLPSGDYLATYPYRSAARGVNFSVSPRRVAAVDVPNSQTLVAGTYDRKACPMVAFAPEGSSSLLFRNAAALLKFRVSENNIVAGRIEVDAADKISGRFRADVDVTSYIPDLVTYTGQTYYSYIDFTIDGSTALATGTDYYVAVRPTSLTSDLKIYLNGNLVKTINASQLAAIQRNQIYNLGTLTTPATPIEKKLFFDFTGAALSGWPTAGNTMSTNQAGGLGCVYPLYGTDYTFILADCTGASGRKVYWSQTATYGHRLVFENAERYVGFPAITGYKLVHVRCESAQLNDGAASTAPQMGITSDIVASKGTPTYVTGGELQTWATGNNHEAYDYELSGTEGNTVYYLFCKIKGGFRNCTLTYIPI